MLETKLRIGCQSEYDTLRQVVLCSPDFMKIKEVINETQQHYVDENIDTLLAKKQHIAFIEALKAHGVQVVLLPSQAKFPEQVFTRDIGFTLGNTVFTAWMERKIRQGEEQVLKHWLQENHVPFVQIESGSIEGGDVLIDRDTIWVGDSDRTSKEAIRELAVKLNGMNLVRIPFAEEYLHLDCVFNVLSPTEALFFPPAFHEKEHERLASRYDLIEVSKEEQFTLGTNILSIGQKKVVSLPINARVNKRLRDRGYTVIEVDISEIIKSGGSFRCITMPLARE
jgi:N-dimethylarginine dimethylaminohydrolase